MDVRGKVAVITGGASGIGLATATRLADAGARLVLADIDAAALAPATAELSTRTDVIGVETDVSLRASVEDLAAAAFERFGTVDIAFFNAGVGTTGPTIEASHADWEWMLGVNLWGAIHGVEAFLPRMAEGGAGRHVIFTASFAGLVANADLGPYSVAKYGVVALAETLHREMRETGLAISVLCPMIVRTNIETSHRNRPASLGGPGAGRDVDFSDPSLAGSMITADDAAAVVLRGIQSPRLYLFTHQECRTMVARRFAKIDADFE